MGYSVQEKAECFGTFRWIEIQLMEMLARWVPTTPEMEVKILFGRHLWDCAQHADALGRRAFELRAPLHYTLPANPAYAALLCEAAGLVATADRVSVVYDVIAPGLVERYREYLANTDALMDEPSVRILDGAMHDFQRMAVERTRLAGSIAVAAAIRPAEWRTRDKAVGSAIMHGDDRRARGARA